MDRNEMVTSSGHKIQDTKLKTQDPRRRTQDTTTLSISDFRFRIFLRSAFCLPFSVLHPLFSIVHRLSSIVPHPSSSAFCLLSFVFCIFVLSGCAKEQQSELVAKPLCITGLEKTAVMKIAENVLTGMHFAIEKADPNSGQIRTRPLPGAQFFEVWRDDNVGSFNKAEANLHSIRRTVELRIYPQGEKICLDCVVKVARLSLPEREVGSSARAYQIFSRSASSLQKIRLNPQQQADVAWLDLGEDKSLAAEILKRFEQQLSQQNSSPK